MDDVVPQCMASSDEYEFENVTVDNYTATQSDDVDYILHGVVITVLVCFGCFGNTLTIFVFTRPRHWPCLNYYLVVLALWDIALLLSAFLLFASPTLMYGNMPIFGTYVLIYPYFYVFSNLTLIGSLWIVVMLTVERFLAIYRPLQHRTFMNNHTRVKSILTMVSFLAVAYNIPRFFDLTIVTCLDDDGNYQTKVDKTWLYKDWYYHTFYKVIGNLLFVYAGPFLVLTTLTIFICIEIRRATMSNRVVLSLPVTNCGPSSNGSTTNNLIGKKISLRRTVLVLSKHQSSKDINYGRQQSTNVNLMSMIVVSKFLCCYSLPTILDICELSMSEESFNNLSLLVSLGNVFVVFNSSCNFLIYFSFGKSFRECLLRCLRNALVIIFNNKFQFGGGSSAEEQNSVTVSLVSNRRHSSHSAYSPHSCSPQKRTSYAAIETTMNNSCNNKMKTSSTNKDLWV